MPWGVGPAPTDRDGLPRGLTDQGIDGKSHDRCWEGLGLSEVSKGYYRDE